MAGQLRIYGFTDLPPSLPLLSGTLFTRILESSTSYRRLWLALHLDFYCSLGRHMRIFLG